MAATVPHTQRGAGATWTARAQRAQCGSDFPAGPRQACCETMPPRPRAPVSSDERRLTATVPWGPGAGAASPPTAPAAPAQTRAAGLRGWLRRQGVALTLASTLVLGVTWGKGSPLQVSLLTCRQNTLTSEGCCELHQTTRWTQARHFAHVTTVGRRAAGTAGGGEARTRLRPRSGLGARGPTAPVCALCPQGATSRAHRVARPWWLTPPRRRARPPPEGLQAACALRAAGEA